MIGEKLLFLDNIKGVNFIPTNGGEAVTVNTTGLESCSNFISMYFATGKLIQILIS